MDKIYSAKNQTAMLDYPYKLHDNMDNACVIISHMTFQSSIVAQHIPTLYMFMCASK